jgi:hypothetical protein
VEPAHVLVWATRLLPTHATRPDLCRGWPALVEAVAVCPVQQGVQRVGGVVDAWCRSPSLAKRTGIVAMVNWRRSTSSISSQVMGWRRSSPARRGPSRHWRWCGRGRSGCSRQRPRWGRGPCATHPAARCRPGGSSTGGTPRWTSTPPAPRWPVRSRTGRRRAGHSAGSAPAPSPAIKARPAEPASGAPSRPRLRRGTGASCRVARAARAMPSPTEM